MQVERAYPGVGNWSPKHGMYISLLQEYPRDGDYSDSLGYFSRQVWSMEWQGPNSTDHLSQPVVNEEAGKLRENA